MNLTEITSYPDSPAICENHLMSKISDVVKECECCLNMMIGIYLVEKEQFLYYNSKLRKFAGSNYDKLLDEGWDFWFSQVDNNESVWMNDRVTNFFAQPFSKEPLTLRYHFTNFYGKRIFLKHEIVLHKMNRHTLALNYWTDITNKERIELHFDRIHTTYGNSENKLQCITAREKEVLRLIANGFSSKEIADMLFISNHTAISHRKNLIEKFQVKNTAHLIKKAASFIYL